jgi:hypothetical protein
LKDSKSYVPGNPMADYFITQNISNEYLAWALLNYLEQKNIIDHDDFMSFLKFYCEKQVEKMSEPND